MKGSQAIIFIIINWFSSIIINYPNDNDRLRDICKIILENINNDTVICLQECSRNLLIILNNKVDLLSYNIFSQEIDEDVFMITISPVNFYFKIENIPKNYYEKLAHGYLIIYNDNIKIINCHLIPKFAAKGDIYPFINDTCVNKKCIVAGDFNEKYKNIIKYLRDYLADLYLDWINNFLTIERFAEYYGLDEDDARDLLVLSKKCHEQRVDFIKDMEEA